MYIDYMTNGKEYRKVSSPEEKMKLFRSGWKTVSESEYELARLRAENERLREALGRIANDGRMMATGLQRIAQVALKESETK